MVGCCSHGTFYHPMKLGMVWCLRLAGQIAQQKQPPSAPEHHWHLRVIYRGGWTLSIPTPLLVKLAPSLLVKTLLLIGPLTTFWLEKPVFWLEKTRSFEWCKMNLLPLAWSTRQFLVPPNRIRPTFSISSVAWNRVQTGYVPNKPNSGWRTHEDRSFCLVWGGCQSRNATDLLAFSIFHPIWSSNPQDHPRLQIRIGYQFQIFLGEPLLVQPPTKDPPKSSKLGRTLVGPSKPS